jgi:hypothetical protein
MKINNLKVLKTLAWAFFYLCLGSAVLASYVIKETVEDADASLTIEMNLTAPSQNIHEQSTLCPAFIIPLLTIKPLILGFIIGQWIEKSNKKGE